MNAEYWYIIKDFEDFSLFHHQQLSQGTSSVQEQQFKNSICSRTTVLEVQELFLKFLNSSRTQSSRTNEKFLNFFPQGSSLIWVCTNVSIMDHNGTWKRCPMFRTFNVLVLIVINYNDCLTASN